MNSAVDLVGQFKIPPRPDTLTRLLRELHDDAPDMTRICNLIKKDVTLFGALLRIINSPALGFQGVKTVEKAIMLLGIKRVGQLAQVFMMQQALTAKLKMERFWDTAAEVADIASQLATRLTGICPQDAYTAGMFHDVGVPLMMQAFPDFKDLLVEANRNPNLCLATIETDRYGFSHYDVGFALGKQWLLPPTINLAIFYQPQFEDVHRDRIAMDDIDKIKTLTALLELAKNFSAMHRKYWRTADGLHFDISPLAYEYFDMGAEDFGEFRDNYLHTMATDT
jgi:HD-like signal output (HDOD) protein